MGSELAERLLDAVVQLAASRVRREEGAWQRQHVAGEPGRQGWELAGSMLTEAP